MATCPTFRAEWRHRTWPPHFLLGEKNRREHLAAFVGYKWPDGYGKKPVVRFDENLMPPDKQQFAAFKVAIEARIRAEDLSSSEEVVPGYWSWVDG